MFIISIAIRDNRESIGRTSGCTVTRKPGRTIVTDVKMAWRINCRAKGAAGQRESAILSYLIHCFFFPLHNRDFALTTESSYDSAVTHPARHNELPSREGRVITCPHYALTLNHATELARHCLIALLSSSRRAST